MTSSVNPEVKVQQKLGNKIKMRQNTGISVEREALASLRRLKLQESLLETAAMNALEDPQLKVRLHALSDKRNKDFNDVKKSYNAAKSLFEQLKHNVSSADRVSKADIEEYKKLAVELDSRIINFKKFLDKELIELREAETELTNEIQEAEQNMKEVNTKLAVKPYTVTIPSSVKVLRNTPSTCVEVQRFREFQQSSGGHRGGWGDREHATFVAQRRLLCRVAPPAPPAHDKFNIEPLVASLLEKIPGLTAEEVVQHDNWYREYARLKAEQQAALDKWRLGRKLIKQQRNSLDESQGDWKCSATNKTDKPLLAPGKRKAFGIKQLAMEAKMLERKIEEVKLVNLPKEITPDSRKGTDLAAIKEPKRKIISSTTISLSKPERLCCPSRSSEHSLERDVTTEEVYSKEVRVTLRRRSGNRNKTEEGEKEKTHYASPTKLWNLRRELASDKVTKVRDFKLHIPMANSPKLGISDWRRCLVGETHR